MVEVHKESCLLEKKIKKAAVASSVLYWNGGAVVYSNMLSICGIQDPGINTLRGYRQFNSKHIMCSAQKCPKKYRKQRKL